MKVSMLGIAIAAAGFSTAAVAQKPSSALYALHSSPSGSCPGLDWHITVTGNKLDGFVGVSHSTHVWHLDGTIQPASAGTERTFEMEADELGGAGRKAMVKGTSGGEYVVATITGSGVACDGKTLDIPRALNGVEGGGG